MNNIGGNLHELYGIEFFRYWNRTWDESYRLKPILIVLSLGITVWILKLTYRYLSYDGSRVNREVFQSRQVLDRKEAGRMIDMFFAKSNESSSRDPILEVSAQTVYLIDALGRYCYDLLTNNVSGNEISLPSYHWDRNHLLCHGGDPKCDSMSKSNKIREMNRLNDKLLRDANTMKREKDDLIDRIHVSKEGRFVCPYDKSSISQRTIVTMQLDGIKEILNILLGSNEEERIRINLKGIKEFLDTVSSIIRYEEPIDMTETKIQNNDSRSMNHSISLCFVSYIGLRRIEMYDSTVTGLKSYHIALLKKLIEDYEYILRNNKLPVNIFGYRGDSKDQFVRYTDADMIRENRSKVKLIERWNKEYLFTGYGEPIFSLAKNKFLYLNSALLSQSSLQLQLNVLKLHLKGLGEMIKLFIEGSSHSDEVLIFNLLNEFESKFSDGIQINITDKNNEPEDTNNTIDCTFSPMGNESGNDIPFQAGISSENIDE